MPNWTCAVLSAKGLTKMDIFTEGNFDFDKIIPQPEGLYNKDLPVGPEPNHLIVYYTERFTKDAEQCMREHPERTQYFINTYHENDVNGFQKSIDRVHDAIESFFVKGEPYRGCSDIDEMYKLGRRYENNRKRTGAYTWYDWCCHNWGTKWNASDTEIINDDSIRFFVPWTIPHPVLERLSEMHPDTRFFIDWDTENNYTNYHVEYINGRDEKFKSTPWDLDEPEE